MAVGQKYVPKLEPGYGSKICSIGYGSKIGSPPNWNPGKRKLGLKPAVPWWFNSDSYPNKGDGWETPLARARCQRSATWWSNSSPRAFPRPSRRRGGWGSLWASGACRGIRSSLTGTPRAAGKRGASNTVCGGSKSPFGTHIHGKSTWLPLQKLKNTAFVEGILFTLAQKGNQEVVRHL